MKRHLTCFLFILLFGLSFGQNQEIDSLLREYKAVKKDTARAMLMTKLSLAYSEVGEIVKAYQYSESALALCTKLKYHKGTGLVYYSFGRLNQYRGDLDVALNYHFKALSILESEKDFLNEAWTLLNIGIVYCAKEKYEEAKKHDLKALQLFKQINFKQGIAYSTLNLSIICSALRQLPEALEYIIKSEEVCLEIQDNKGLSYVYTAYGNVYKDLGRYNKALKYYYECIKLKEVISDKVGISLCYADIGQVHYLQAQYAKARADYDIALNMALKVEAKDVLMASYLGLSLVDSAEGDFKQAYNHQKLFSFYRHQVMHEENGKKSFQLLSLYEKEKKDKEIKLLQKEKEQEKIISEEENKFLLIILISSVLGLVTIIGFSISLHKRVNFMQRQRNIIAKQKERSDEQHKSIKDSIVYARRIQRALLTSDDYIKAHLNLEFFIFYQPKDIVSGDFYWAVEHKRKFYLITADCTGHGVPGAFMSLLNISFLNELIVEKNISSPANILNEQRKQIIKALNPTGTENSQDGMDCVLCEYDLDNLTLNFAAANNCLWIIRDNKILEFKGDKMPVGKHLERNDDFTQQSILLEHGDVMYTFTDGVADQFGGEEGKKFKYKQLSSFLLSIHHLPMHEQRTLIEIKINEWKGNREQTDDMLIVGVKI
jgi:serine phosphatase RsbU (regulator of sigma subunit)